MAAPELKEPLDRELLEQVEKAAARWKQRSQARAERQRAVSEGRFLEAESPERLAARVNRLVGGVRRKMRDARPPSNRCLSTLVGRPALTADDVDNELVKEAVLESREFLSVEFLERGAAASRSVGRIVRRAGGRYAPRGTGFLVGPGVLLTNHHVLPSQEMAAQCAIEMDYEQNAFGPPKQLRRFELSPDMLFLADLDLDFALVAVAEAANGTEVAIRTYSWLPLDARFGKISLLPSDTINIVQHPLGREKEVVLRENRVLDLRTGPKDDELGAFLHYEADTERGSSGSPVFNDQWEVIALHHSGVPHADDAGQVLKKDGTPWQRDFDPFEQIAWVANEGVRVSSIVAFIERAQVRPNQRALIESLLSAQAPRVFAQQSVAGEEGNDGYAARDPDPGDAVPPRRSFPGEASGGYPLSLDRADAPDGLGRMTFSIPLQVTIELGGAAARPALAPRPALSIASGNELVAERMGPGDYTDRRGFNDTFLGDRVPLPALKPNPDFGPPVRISSNRQNPLELKYHHFSVIMSERRRLAYVSAVNVNFGAPFQAGREQGTKTWRFDPRVPERLQIDDAYYHKNDYDRGHLTRRHDAAWGYSRSTALAANNDTFHWTNAAPQHRFFNQPGERSSKDLMLWGDLENHISEQVGRGRVSVFNGPIFGNRDKPLKDVRVPLRYFKIVVFKDERDRLGAAGFVLNQSELIADLAEEAFEVGEFEIRQRSIESITRLIDLDFSYLNRIDRYRRRRGRAPVEEGLEDVKIGKPVRKPADVAL